MGNKPDTSPLDPNKYYSITELANILGYDRRVIRNNLQDKQDNGIPFIKIGSKHSILGQDVLQNAGSVSYQSKSEKVDTRGAVVVK